MAEIVGDERRRMSEKLPKGWEVKTLGEITDIFKGGTPKRNVERYFQGSIPWATPTDITKLNGALYIDDTETHISKEALGKSAARLLPVGTVLLTSRATVGKVAIARVPIATNQGFANFLCKGEVNNLFLAYYLQSITNLLVSLGTGTTFLEVTKTTLLDVEIPLPPLEAQRKIASILSNYDNLIENNTRRIKILEEMAGAICREWFVEFRFPGHENVKMVESELGLIPQGWEMRYLRDVTSVITKGTTPTTLGKQFVDDGVNFIKVESIDGQGGILEGKLAKIDDETHGLLKRSQLAANDILFSIAGAIGRVTIVLNRFLPANTNQALAIIRPSDLSLVSFLYQTLSSSTFLSYSLERVVQTAQANVSLSVLSSAPIIMPTNSVLTDFNRKLDPLIGLIDRLTTMNTNLRATRDLLLPKLISGELDVSNLDIEADTIQ